MTSPTIPGSAQQNPEGRNLRDVVEYTPGQVNDAWCRKVLRKILHSLELQYAMQMPHRAITPDTIVFHANGEPLLISDDIDAAPAPDARQADDLTALAHVIHFAITAELAPAGPLAGRVDGYSAALVATIDACMDPDPARRPRSVDAVRGLLGMAAPGPLAGAVTLPGMAAPPAPSLPAAPAPLAHAPAASSSASAPAPPPAPAERASADPGADAMSAGIGAPAHAPIEAPHASKRRGRRWAIAAGGGALALALALVWFAQLRGAGSYDRVVRTLPPGGAGAAPGLRAPGGGASAGSVAMGVRTERAAVGAAGKSTGAAAITGAHGATGGAANNVAGGTANNVAGAVTADPASHLAGSAASGPSSGGATLSGGDADQPEAMTRAAPGSVSAASAANAASAVNTVAATVSPAVPPRASAVAPAHGKASVAVPPGAVSGNASYQLQIKPWGVVYVDGVERGTSPPLKRLVLTPGRHTIRIAHPDYRDSILEFDSAQTTSNGKIIVDFNRDAE